MHFLQNGLVEMNVHTPVGGNQIVIRNSINRARADLILTYFANPMARLLG